MLRLSARRVRPRSLVELAVYAACAGFAFVPQLSRAQQATTQAEVVRSYALPAGALTSTLNRFAAEAGIFLSGAGDLTADKTSPGLTGSYSVRDGLAAILAGSGLEAIAQSTGGYSLRRAPAPTPATDHGAGSSRPVTTLPMVKAETTEVEDGSADAGYRSDAVSGIGPWQGRTLQDTPYSITVIPHELIENLQATTPDQLFRINPTTQLLYPQRDNDGPLYQQRGFSLSAPYQDGLPGDQIAHATTIEDVERVEMLSGLSGFLYGIGNVGGLTNYVSKQPTAQRLNAITLGNNGGSNYYVHGDFGGPFDRSGRFGYRVNAFGQDGETVVDNEDSKKTFFSAALDWRVTDRLLLQVLGSKRDFEVSGGRVSWALAPGVARPSADQIDATVSWGQPWATKHWENTKYGARLRWEASDTLTLRAAWNRNENERVINTISNTIQANGTFVQRILNYYPPGTNPLLSEHTDEASYLFADLSFRTGAMEHKLTMGGQRRRSQQARFANSAPAVTIGSGRSLDSPAYVPRPTVGPIDRGALINPRVVGIVTDNFIVGDDITLSERWSLLAGLSHAVIDDRLGGEETSATTPSVSVVFKPIPSLTTYVSYMESLEQGGVAAEDFNGVPVVNAGEALDPLTSDQLEIGAKWSLGELLLTTALFEIDKSLQYFDISTPAAPVFVQDGRQVHRGIEFTLVGKATEDLTLIGGLTWLDAEVTKQKQSPELEGKRPTWAAEKLVKMRAEYRMPMLPALTLIGGAVYTDDIYFDALNTDRLSSYTLVDVGARYSTSLAGYPTTLRLDLNNATDKRYWTFGSVIGDPRTLVFSVNAQF